MKIPLPHTVVGPLALGLGIALEAAPRVLVRPRPGDPRRIAIALAVGLLGLVPVPGEHLFPRSATSYSLPLHLYLVVAVVGLGLAWLFRQRLVPRVGALLLVAWNLLALAALWSLDGHAGPWILLALLGTAFTLANAFTGLARGRTAQWLLFAGYVASLAVLMAVEGRPASWTSLENFVGTINTRSAAGNLIEGAALFFLVANGCFALAVVARALRGRRGGGAVLDTLTRDDAGGTGHRQRGIAILVVLPLVLVGNALRPVVEPSRLVAAAIALLPLVAIARDPSEHRAGGSPSIS